MAAAEVMKWANDQCNAIVATAENQLTVDDYDCCAGGLSTPDTPKEIGYFFLSFLALCYVFLGVALGADVFMSSIETITSTEKTVKVTVDGVQKIFHTHVWNATVANLTLMALGSSAPEILLNVIDTFSGEFHASKLGPGTIVGSAAFNLFVITAVCIVAIPAGEKRTIRSMAVFVTTAVWSVWAYVWLFIILIVWTPDIITVAEAALTIGFLAILIIQAYAVDVYWDQGKAKAVKALDTARGSTRRLIRLQNGDPLDEASVKAELNARKAENQAPPPPLPPPKHPPPPTTSPRHLAPPRASVPRTTRTTRITRITRTTACRESLAPERGPHQPGRRWVRKFRTRRWRRSSPRTCCRPRRGAAPVSNLTLP